MTAVHKAPSDYPGGKQGDVLTVEFTVLGIPCLGLNGGPAFKHSEAFSFQIATDNQEETDRYWDAIIGNGGQESQCGWCKDRWGLSWQITPRVLMQALAAGGAEAKRAFEAMMVDEKRSTSQPSKQRGGDDLDIGHCRSNGGLLQRASIFNYLQSTLLSCEAAICHLPLRFNQVSVQTWHTFASGCALSLPMACSLP